MAFEHKEGSASLFKNDKDGNEARPDYTGDGMVNGEVVKLAAWVKETAGGKPFMSLKIENKGEVAPKDADPLANTDDDMPF